MIWDTLSISLSFLSLWVITLSAAAWVDASPPGPGGPAAIIILGFAVAGAFTTSDLFWFFVLFEAALIPLFLLIGRWGARTEKERAALYFFFYTFVSSVSFLATLAFIYSRAGSTHISTALRTGWGPCGLWCAIGLIIPLLVKLPAWPVHLWLPLAHVEAPTAGSILLAALVLKLAGVGLLRWVYPLWGGGATHLIPGLVSLGVISLLTAAFLAARQGDLKRLIAYSSVSHMGFMPLACGGGAASRLGAIALMIAHGLTSGGLFAWVGLYYLRSHSRAIKYCRGLWVSNPVSVWLLFSLVLASMGFPPSLNFVAELLLLLNTLPSFWGLAAPLAIGLVAGVFYHLFLFGRTAFGSPSSSATHFPDLSRSEALMLGGWSLPAWALGLHIP